MSSQLRLTRSLSHDAFPHKCRPDELEFEVVEFSLDGRDPVQPESPGIVELTDYEGWKSAELTVEITASEELLDAVFPESGEYPGRLIVAGHCTATYLRDRKIIASHPLEPGTHTNVVELNVHGVGGAVELTPYLVRAEDRDPVGNYGTSEGVLLSDGPKWTIQITEEKSGTESVLKVDKTSFADKHEEDESTRFPPEEEMYYLDLEKDPENPVLWFNEDHREIVQVVWRGESDYDQLTEELVWNHVLTDVWTRMLTVAALEFESEESEWVPEWHAGVFDVASQYLFPEEDTSPRKAAKFLKEELLGGGNIVATKRIERTVQEILDPASGFKNHIDRLGDD